jgi:uncharacterized phage protein gp47/JayE
VVTVPAGSLARDEAGHLWRTTEAAILEAPGTVFVGAKCTTPGAIEAVAGSIKFIASPIAGWVSVTNAANAVPGREVESDAAVRERRAKSVSNNAVGILTAMYGSILSISGVKKLRIYENKNGADDANGLPAHSICVVSSGGEDQDIAGMIFAKKAPGCKTYGDVSATVIDVYGQENTISFKRPTSVNIGAAITLKKMSGYNTAIEEQIKQEVVDALNAYPIGAAINSGDLWGAIYSINVGRTLPAYAPYAVTVNRGGDGLQAMQLAFNEDGVASVDRIVISYA